MTEHSNSASQAVMQRLGMRMRANPLPEPIWLQIVGILDQAPSPHQLAAASSATMEVVGDVRDPLRAVC
jgi:hypothetical protein